MSTNIPSDVYLHKVIYRALSNISKSRKEKEEKVKIVRIITKLIENIVNAEKNQEDSEKFRKIRVKNPNISLMFEIEGNYEFIKSMGFEEKTFDNNEYLYLSKSNVNIPLLEKLLSYMELLLLNFQSENKDEENYYEKNSLKRSVYTEDYFQNPVENEINNNNNNNANEMDNNDDNEEKYDSFDIDENNDIFEKIEESAETQIIKKDKDTVINPPSTFSKQDEQKGNENSDNPIKANDNKINNNNNNNDIKNNNNAQQNNFFGDPKKKNKKVKYKLKLAPGSNLLNNPNSNPDNKANTKYFQFNSIAIDCNKSSEKKINLSASIKKLKTSIKDDIGKQCLVLTNIFREENYLPELEWNDELWKIAYAHSKNMGEKKVHYGHNGFLDRIKQCPFTLIKSCENVFMCYDSCREIEVAKMAVDGWINSPNSRNLLSDTTICAIASYKNKSGTIYLTQLFGKI